MIRIGIPVDFTQIDAFDVVSGDRQRAIEDRRLWVYLVEDRAVAYITAVLSSCWCGHFLIFFLCVYSAHRRQEIASQLLTEVENKYRQQKLFISTESNNDIMLDLIKQREYILAGLLAKINDDESDEVYFYRHPNL